MATFVSFKSVRIATSAATVVEPCYVFGARLVSTTTADVTVHFHDAASAALTSASTRVSTLFLTNPGSDEIGYPLRANGKIVVVGSATVAANPVYVFVR